MTSTPRDEEPTPDADAERAAAVADSAARCIAAWRELLDRLGRS